jgi:peptidyl-prolyl cis-trans isomerase SurA
MKLMRNVVPILRRVLTIATLLSLMQGTSSGLPVDRVLATVNNNAVTLSDYKKFVSMINGTAVPDTVNEYYLNRIIEEKLILLEAAKAGIDATEDEISWGIDDIMKQRGLLRQDMEKRLADEGMTLADYRQRIKNNILSLKIIDKEVNAKLVLGPEDVQQFYENNLELFQESPEKVLVKAIYLKLNDSASLTEITDLKIKSLRIYADVIKGVSFDKLAMQYTDESLKKRDAILGEFERGMLIPVLDEKIFFLKEGEVSEPVWTKDGAYILKVFKITRPRYTPLEKVKEQIRERVYEQRREEKYNEWLKRLWDNASVTIRQ